MNESKMNFKTATTSPKETVEVAPVDGAISTYDQLDQKMVEVNRDYMPGDEVPSIEVTPDLFKALLRGKTSAYITYGKPGVKIFVQGTQESIEAEESLPVEEAHRIAIERKMAENKELLRKRNK